MTRYRPSCKMLEHVAFADALPLATSQKVQRAELRALAAVRAGQPQCFTQYFDPTSMKKRPT